jgi:hypothetical protein
MTAVADSKDADPFDAALPDAELEAVAVPDAKTVLLLKDAQARRLELERSLENMIILSVNRSMSKKRRRQGNE